MKKNYSVVMDTYSKITEKYELKTIAENLSTLFCDIQSFKVRVLFVGAFSAGKSALMNSIIKRDLLEEGQLPETAIANEVIFDEKEYIEAVSVNERKEYKIDNAKEIDIQKYDYLVWHLKNEELKQIDDTILVDMPGFNSGIKKHNDAICRYAGKGNAYILVIDCEDGAIKNNISDFISEIKNYDDNLSIAITKTDLKLEEDIIQIKNSIESNATMLFGKQVPIITTSKYDDKVNEKMIELIKSYDKEGIFTQTFLGRIYDIGIKCLDALEIYKKSLSFSVESYEEEIKRHNRSKEELIKRLESEKHELEKRLIENVAPSILNDLSNTLYANIDTLSKGLKTGEKAFSISVNNLLRPVLINSTQAYVEQSFGEFISDLDLSTIDGSVKEISSNALMKYKEANDKLQEIAKNGQKLNATYKAITTALAVTTSVVAPWLELILIFLPDIISLLGAKQKEKEIESKVGNEIIPQIINRIKPEVEKSLKEMKNMMLEQVEKEINTLIDGEIEAIEKAENSKKTEEKGYNDRIEEVEKDIEMIKSNMEMLKEHPARDKQNEGI